MSGGHTGAVAFELAPGSDGVAVGGDTVVAEGAAVVEGAAVAEGAGAGGSVRGAGASVGGEGTPGVVPAAPHPASRKGVSRVLSGAHAGVLSW